MRSTATRTILLAAVTLLSACGGSSTSSPSAPGSATPNRFLQGTIASRSTGQLVVNGVTLSTPATVRIEGVERPESELREGMEVDFGLFQDNGRSFRHEVRQRHHRQHL